MLADEITANAGRYRNPTAPGNTMGCDQPLTMYPSVLASAIGNPIAAPVATALWIRTLQRVMNGTARNAPPAPTNAEANPMPAPTLA